MRKNFIIVTDKAKDLAGRFDQKPKIDQLRSIRMLFMGMICLMAAVVAFSGYEIYQLVDSVSEFKRETGRELSSGEFVLVFIALSPRILVAVVGLSTILHCIGEITKRNNAIFEIKVNQAIEKRFENFENLGV